MRFRSLSNLIFLAALLLWPIPTQPQTANKAAKNVNQWALLVGVNDYPGDIQDLRFARNDARDIKDLLVSSAGFAEDHIRLLTDDGVGAARATKQNIFATIDQHLASRLKSGDQLIVFLAGHGIAQGFGPEAKSYFLPADVEAQTKETLVRTAIDLEELARKLSALPASQFTVFVDACREDPFPGRGIRGNTMTDVMARGLRIVRPVAMQASLVPPTSVVFYSCRIGERAYENPELQHGVFTYYILRGIRELAMSPNGRVEAGQLAGYLSRNVRQWATEYGQRAKLPIEQTPTMVATEVRGPVFIVNVTPFAASAPTLATTGAVTLNTSPEGALISINGQAAGSGPLLKELQPNQYVLRAELAGFQPVETKINVLPGYQQEITLTLQPIVANASYERGVQFEQQQLWPQAIAAYEQALREDPNALAVYERLANVYLQNNRYNEAVALLTTAVQKFPNNATLLAQRSRALSTSASLNEQTTVAVNTTPVAQAEEKPADKKSKKDDKQDEEKVSKKESKKGGKKEKKEDKDDDEQVADKGNPKPSGDNAISEAIRAAEAAIQRDARFAAGYLALGFAYLLHPQYQAKAMDSFVRASALTPDDAEAYFGVGYAYRLRQQYQQAIPQLKKALALRPDYYEAQRELAYCYSTVGQTDQAIRQYQLASGHRRKAKNSAEWSANNLALASLYRKKGEEVGGTQGEEYKKAGKSYEDDAREYDPTLKGAVKKLTDAGVSKIIENLLPEDARKVLEPKLPGDVKIKLPVKVPVGAAVKEPIKEVIKNVIKEPIKLPVKGPVKEPVKEPGKKSVKEPVKIKVPVTLPVKETVKEPVKKSGKESVKKLEKEPSKKSDKEPVKKLEKETVKTPVKVPIKVPDKITVKKLL
jgi:tetratricopeptide (TPR) repeat protein/uncharacterized caspase-like protein